MIDRKSPRHNWCTLREFCKSGEIDLSLSHLHNLLFALALVVLLRVLILSRLLISGTSPGEEIETSTSEATIVAIHTVGLLHI